MSYQDPYAPSRKATREPAARRPPRTPPILRMRRVGITPAEEQEALRAWAEWSDEEKFEFLDAWDNLRDDEIRAMLDEGRTDAPYVSLTDVPNGTVDAVLDWVGEDRARAAAALEVENDREAPRKTVLAALEALTG